VRNRRVLERERERQVKIDGKKVQDDLRAHQHPLVVVEAVVVVVMMVAD